MIGIAAVLITILALGIFSACAHVGMHQQLNRKLDALLARPVPRTRRKKTETKE